MNASEVMSRAPITVGRDASVREAIRLMLDNRVSGLPVVGEAGELLGILTEGDLLRRSETGTERRHRSWLDYLLGPGRMADEYVRSHGRKVDEIMTHEVVSVGGDASLAEIVELMERRHIKRVPVVEREILIGIVSRADLIAALGRALDREVSAVVGDDDIRERVLAELGKVPWAPRTGLSVTVENGVVELNGVIFDEKEREALRVAAENVPGVKAVEDRLVWVEPVSGTVIEPPPERPATKPAAR
ncbi:MAG TPA: CBS domain-containing protein [Stellaceae bacterium]|jgi:CBS domain-containing protein|nr:CBS domain-containing protein [Stellaceae bacterium]